MNQPTNPFSLEGKRIVVTGASSGIGRQCAITCSQMGASVTLVARNPERLAETLSMLEGTAHDIVAADLNDIPPAFIKNLVATNGAFDGLVHSAGIEKTLPAKLLKPQDYEDLFMTNAASAFELCRQFSNPKCMNANGSIVLISSITSIIARKGLAAYAASKGALNSGARVMALEFAKRGIRVNTISPGTVLTPMMENVFAQMTEEDYQKRIEGFPLGLGNPEDIANGAVYLLSNASRWLTGQNLVIDGGYTAR